MRNQFRVQDDFAAIRLYHKGRFIESTIDASDLNKLSSFDVTWSAFWSEAGRTFYVCCNLHNSQIIYLHRFLLDAKDGMDVDHWDHNGLNNRRSNIREVTKTENQLNRRLQTNNTSGTCGVCWDKSRQSWKASGKISGKTVFLGRFPDKQQAADVATQFRNILKGTYGKPHDAGSQPSQADAAGA